jgi:hypothetical protein
LRYPSVFSWWRVLAKPGDTLSLTQYVLLIMIFSGDGTERDIFHIRVGNRSGPQRQGKRGWHSMSIDDSDFQTTGPGGEQPRDTGADQGADHGADQGANVGADQGADTGAGSGTDESEGSGMEGMEDDVDHGADQGADAGADYGAGPSGEHSDGIY